MKLNIPNQITIARLAISAVFFVLLVQYSQRNPEPWMLDICTAIFIVAAVSDFLDGYLARKWGQVTPLGRILDPLADKVLICGSFIILAGRSFVDADGVNVTGVASWMVVVIVTRELLITGLRGFNEAHGKEFGADIQGKLKMWTQSIAVPTVLLVVAHESTWAGHAFWQILKTLIVWATVIITALSVVGYLIRSRYILDEGSN